MSFHRLQQVHIHPWGSVRLAEPAGRAARGDARGFGVRCRCAADGEDEGHDIKHLKQRPFHFKRNFPKQRDLVRVCGDESDDVRIRFPMQS